LSEQKKLLNSSLYVPPIIKSSQDLSDTPSLPTVSQLSSSSPTLTPTSGLLGNASSLPTPDVQTQMLMMLMESFSKLSSALSEKSRDTKSDWPKFSGDIKKFRAWYLEILVQLALLPWQELYDSVSHDVVSITTNTILNGKLYAKLLLSLEGTALQNIISCTHLCANGVLLLQELSQTYHPKNVPEVIMVKTSQFWGQTKRLSSESIDVYYNQFHELLDDLSTEDETISKTSAIQHFLFNLGPEFQTIQNSYRIGNLPLKWQTQDWPTLLVLCQDYYNSVKPQGPSSRETSNDSNFDCIAHQKKVKEWFLQPSKFCKEIESEQSHHAGKCLYHLSKSHQTVDCLVKKECEKILAGKKVPSSTSNSTNSSSGQLHHITEETFLDTVDNSVDADVSPEDYCNNTNEEVLHYFTRVTNHYLHLVKSTPSLASRHSMRYPILADSGANHHMFRDIEFFKTLTPASGNAILGDGKTSLSVQGIGTVKLLIDGHTILIDNVRYIPTLAKSIYSLFLHVLCPSHGLYSSFEEGLHIVFPGFRTKAILGTHDIYIDAVPDLSTKCSLPIVDAVNHTELSSVCCNIKQFSNVVQVESAKVDNC
jgi:hypothetical protein